MLTLVTRLLRYPFLALEIFNCEINPLLEKFFEAPEPKETETPVSTSASEKDLMRLDDEEVLIDRDDADMDDNKGSEPAATDTANENAAADSTAAAQEEDKKDEDPGEVPTLQRKNTPMPGKDDAQAMLDDVAAHMNYDDDEDETSAAAQPEQDKPKDEAAGSNEEKKEDEAAANNEPESEETKTPATEGENKKEEVAVEEGAAKDESSAADAPKEQSED